MINRKQSIMTVSIVILLLAMPLNQGISYGVEKSEIGDYIIDKHEQVYPVMQYPLIAPSLMGMDDPISIENSDTPNSFSWTDVNGENFMTPAKNQGNCGSCWDFAALGTLEAMINIQHGDADLDLDLSEQYVLSCLPKAANYYGEGCLGGNPYNAFKYIKNDGEHGNFCNGIITEECFSYYADHTVPCDEKCDEWIDELIPLEDCGYSWPGFDDLEVRQTIKSKLYEHGPLAVGIDCTNHFINWGISHNSPDDYYPDMDQEWRNILNHLVVLVGWKDDDSIPNGGYWICKNSWGSDWGYDGYYNAEYGSMFTGAFISWVSIYIDDGNTPPMKPEIPVGPSKFKIEEEVSFETSTVDEQGHNLQFLFDWGDETYSDWSHYVENGETITMTHTWTEKGSYEIRAMAKDEKGLLSDWSDPLVITLSKSRESDNYACMIMDDVLIPDLINGEEIPVSYVNDLPSYFSWKDDNGKDWTTPAKNQGDCGSCWDFAALGALEAMIKIREGNHEINPDLSEQYVLSCLPMAANNYARGCLGGTPYNAFLYMMENGEEGNFCNGALPESCMQYGADHTIPCEDKDSHWEDQLIPISNCSERFLGLYDQHIIDTVKEMLYNHGPLAAGMNASEEFINWGRRHHRETEYFPDPDMPWGNRLNHIILIVGWKDDESIPNGGYWICKNSWGQEWGYDGFYNIEYGGLFTGSYIAWVDLNITNYHPLKPVEVDGPTSGNTNEAYTYVAVTTDPEEDVLYYCFDWGNGEKSEWLGPYDSGMPCETEYSWPKRGNYQVTVKAKDGHGAESPWSPVVQVSMPRFKIGSFGDRYPLIDIVYSLFERLHIYQFIWG